MPISLFFEYLKGIDLLEAKDQLKAIEASSFPSLKEDARKKIVNKHNDIVSPKEERRTVTMEEAVRILNHGK